MKNKTHYTRVIEWSEEDQLYLGSLPELLFGHCTHGTTVEEVNRNLDECEEMALESLKEEPVRGVRVLVFAPGSRRNWIVKNKIAKLRQNLDMNQKEFAALLGASTSTLKKWESGERTPSGAAAKLLEVLERHPEAVLTR